MPHQGYAVNLEHFALVYLFSRALVFLVQRRVAIVLQQFHISPTLKSNSFVQFVLYFNVTASTYYSTFSKKTVCLNFFHDPAGHFQVIVCYEQQNNELGVSSPE